MARALSLVFFGWSFGHPRRESKLSGRFGVRRGIAALDSFFGQQDPMGSHLQVRIDAMANSLLVTASATASGPVAKSPPRWGNQLPGVLTLVFFLLGTVPLFLCMPVCVDTSYFGT